MSSIRDVKVLLFLGYTVGYLLAVLPPIFIDPLLTTHVYYGARTYPHSKLLCGFIYLALLSAEILVLWRSTRPRMLYFSVLVFIASIVASFPIFRPEIPHANIVAVGVGTAFFSAFSIFVWSIGHAVLLDPSSLKSAGDSTFEYLKIVFTFVRQGAFACVALFSALFFAGYTTGFKFSDMTATSKAELFLLYVNVGFQITFFAIYSIVGVARYFYAMNMEVISQFKAIALAADRLRVVEGLEDNSDG